MRHRRSIGRLSRPELAAPVFTAALGIAFHALAMTQPAWMGERIGPGLFARWLSASAIAVSALWLAAALLKRAAPASVPAPARNPADDDADPAQAKPSATAGIGLLGGVAAFALAFPALGLIAASALAALISGWGAGERRPVGLAASTLAGALAALGVGLTLLPPGARLWPQGL